jgi:hypothetical protein
MGIFILINFALLRVSVVLRILLRYFEFGVVDLKLIDERSETGDLGVCLRISGLVERSSLDGINEFRDSIRSHFSLEAVVREFEPLGRPHVDLTLHTLNVRVL